MGGGMSDPFQPCEEKYKITSQLIDITKDYDISILFSTKSDTVYGANIDPKLHTFQLSISNVNNRLDIEPNIAPIQKRLDFFKRLKDKGFRVGIRIQPFIPGVTDISILEMFKDTDQVSLEGLKLVPQNKDHKEYLLSKLGLNREDFKQMGLLNLKPEIRLELYKPFIQFMNENNIPYSIADNDLHYLGNNYCCCGDELITKSTDFNNTAMIKRYGYEYAKEQLDEEIFECGVRDCKCNQLFTSNRQEGCVSVQDFYDARFYRESSPFSPKFQYFGNLF